MTKHARIVLQDCKHAINKHTDGLQAEDFRISWISVVTLLRAVGHVLEKVDAQQSPAMKKAIHQKWEELRLSRPEPHIFWSFIEEERNRFLKNYKHGIVRKTTFDTLVPGVRASVDLANARGGKISASVSETESYISSGQFEGINEHTVAWMAYEWWKNYLDEIDLLAQHYQEEDG
jgi:hypothetical protein